MKLIKENGFADKIIEEKGQCNETYKLTYLTLSLYVYASCAVVLATGMADVWWSPASKIWRECSLHQ